MAPQQVMIDPRVTPGGRRTTVLPWVPDLLGSDWTDRCAMLIVGQSYAGFLDRYSNRPNRMPVYQYQNAGDWQTFQRDYIPAVVEDDLQYYEKLSPLLQITGSYSRFAVFDIVRASLVERRVVAMISGCQQRRDGDLDLRDQSQRSVFRAYASLPESRRWTWDRVTGSHASLIVALGRTAACQLIHLFLLNGCLVHERNSKRRWTYSGQDWVYNCGMSSLKTRLSAKDWYVVTSPRMGRTWHVVVVVHPSFENEGYTSAGCVIAAARIALGC